MNLVEVLLGTGAADAPALVGERGTTTFGQLAAATGAMAAVLADQGVEPGDRVVVASGNDEAFVTAYLGILHAGAIAVPLNPIAPPSELERQINAVAPRLALAAGPACPMLSAAGATVVPIELDRLPGETASAAVPRDDGDVAVLLFTSGTAGAPKAAMLTHGNLAANIAQVLDHPGLRLRADDRTLGVLPFHHVFGLNVALGVTLAAGGTVVLAERFDAAESARLAHDEHVTVLAGVPTMYTAWLELDENHAPPDTFASVRLAVSGAAPLAPHVGHRFHERFGVVVHQGYGLTEAAPIVTTTALHDREPRPDSIGPVLPGRGGPAGRRRRIRRPLGRPRGAVGQGPQRVPRLLARPGGDRSGAHGRRVAPHRRRRGHRRRRSPPRRSRQGPDHRVGLQRVPGRGRGRPPGRARGRATPRSSASRTPAPARPSWPT